MRASIICFCFYRWSCDGLLSVGREDDFDMPFMSYKDRSPFVINYIGVSTAWGATGEWIIEGMLTHCGASFVLVFLRLKIPKLYECHKCGLI